MRMLKVLWLTMTAALLLNSCAIKINDSQWCSPIPQDQGAVCDNFLTSNQLILDETQWQALQTTWISQGKAVECTNSDTLGDIKTEIEQLCSVTSCDYETQAKIVKGLLKLKNLR